MPELLGLVYQLLTKWFEPEPPPEPEPTPSSGPTPQPEPVPVPTRPEASVVAAINAARASEGLPALVEDESMSRLAKSWAASMASWGVLDHGDFAHRIASIDPNTAAAEDIAEGQPDATAAVDAWMDDPPHRANILGDFNQIGVGFDRDEAGSIYWCADFVQRG